MTDVAEMPIPRPAPPPAHWFVAEDDDTVIGPFPSSRIREMVKTGTIDKDTRILREGTDNWKTVSDFPSLAGMARVPVTATRGRAKDEPRLAGFWIRAGAFTLDSLILGVPSFVIYSAAVYGFSILLTGSPDLVEGATKETVRLLAYIPLLCLVVPYYVLTVGSRWQATPGKRLVGIYIVKEDGSGPIGRSDALYRYLLSCLSYWLACIGYLMAAFSLKKQTMHDMLAKTLVVYGKL